VKHDERDRDGARRQGRGAGHDEDLVRTVALGGAPAPAGALDETLPVNGGGERNGGRGSGGRSWRGAGKPGGGAGSARFDAARFDGAQYGRFRMGEPPELDAPPEPHAPPELDVPTSGDPDDPQQRGGRLTRRVLFAAAGLSLVGAGGYAAARAVGGRGSRPAAASGPATGSPSGAPAPARSAAASAAAPSASASGPGDLSSSSAAAPPPAPPSPGATAGGDGPTSGAPGGGTVQTQPQFYIHAGPKMIALTLDDGPSNVYTPQVLDLLAQYKITATFCMIGEQIAANASLVREVAAAGHAIVNHTWNHADQSKLSLSAVRSQIQRANDALSDVGVHPAIFRAPYGAWSPTVFRACADANLRPLDWSVDPQDWARPGTSAIVSRIMKNTRTGSIILEHDGGGDRSQTVAALKIVLPQLLDAGYRFTGV